MEENLNYIAGNEIFKTVKIDVEEYGNYLVSNYGRVYSLVRRKFLSGFKDCNGYIQHYLYKNGKCRHVSAHRLVAFVFIKNNDPGKKKLINHKDEKRDNNYYKNLEWCTHSYNITYGDAQKRRIAHCSKPVIQMDNNYNPLTIYPSMSEAGRKIIASTSTIYVACNLGLKRKGYFWAYANVGGVES